MVNNCNLIGRVGKNPEVRHLNENSVVAKCSLATTEKYKKDGQVVEDTTWHYLIFWNALAKVVESYVKQGSLIYVNGKITNRSYDDKDGKKVYVTEIIVSKMQMLGGKLEQEQQSNDQHTQVTQPTSQQGDVGFDDLPF